MSSKISLPSECFCFATAFSIFFFCLIDGAKGKLHLSSDPQLSLSQGNLYQEAQQSEATFRCALVLRYYNIHDGYLSIVEDNDHAERLFSAEIVASLGKLGFTPVLPLDMKAKLTQEMRQTGRK